MSNNNIRTEINKTITNKYNQYLTFTKNIKGSSIENPCEVLNDCILMLLSKDDNKLNKIITYLDFYMIKMLEYSFHSKSSEYQQKYNKLKTDDNITIDNIPEEDDQEERIKYNNQIQHKLDIIDNNWENLTLYEREVFKAYTQQEEKTSFNKLARKTGIPASSLYITYQSAKNKLKYVE